MGLLDQLQSFGQGASNSAASTVTAPVDGLAWLLRKMGVPVPSDPVGGSDWAAKQGLTATPKNHVAGLLGEAFGGVAPMVAAAKAPQIAKGLLQAEANAMAPRTLNPQTGAIVWHGSPHKFDKFDASKIGTGEGAQAYGHGLYLAESKDVGAQYMNNVKPVSPLNLKDAKLQLIEMKSDNWNRYTKEDIARQEGIVAHYTKRLDDKSLYKVDLPDDQIAKMLDWDKPLSQQSNEVQKALTALKDENGYDALQSLKTGYGANFQGATGQDILRALERNTSVTNGRPEVASSFLKKQGIPGIRYLDGGSRGAGQGSSNFVVFPGNEGLLSILERNGQQMP